MAFRPVAALLLMTALLLAGCTQSDDPDGGDGGGSGGTGSASAYVKDAPSDDFREVHVLVSEVLVHRSASAADNATTAVGTGTATGTTTVVANTTLSASASATVSSTNTSTAAGSGSQAGWIVLFSGSIDVDLLNTTGARAAFLGEEDLAAGHYQQIRMTVTKAWGITHTGENKTITVSSGTLRSVKSFEVEAGEETRITIDIDLEKSLKQTGNGQWRMTPVIGKTTAQVVDDESSGEDVAQPGDVETVPESGSGSTLSGSVSASGTLSATGTATGTGTSTATTTSTGP